MSYTFCKKLRSMIKNFHSKMLFGFAIFAFVMSAIFLSSALRFPGAGHVATPVGMLFTALAFVASITAGAIRSINRRLDQAGIKEDSQFPTSCSTETKIQQNKSCEATGDNVPS